MRPASVQGFKSLTSALKRTVPKGYYLGTHRLVSPAETVARVRRLMPAMGITRIANVTGLDSIGIPVVMVCRPNSRALSVSQGKGLDLAAAQASGVMESVETYHAERITLPLKLASYEELRYTHRVVNVDELPRVANGHFHPNLPIHWIEGFDLLQQEPVWVPFEIVHTNYTMAMQRNMSGFSATSNGLASGNDLLEALSHGICEVVERDATTMWRLLDAEARERTRVDLDSVSDPACCSVLAKYAQADILVGAWEITSEVGIPAFLCAIMDRSDNPARQLGYSECMGCHPVREIALLRALTECAQGRLTLIAGSRDDGYPAFYRQQRDPGLIEQQRATLTAGGARRPFNQGPEYRSDTFSADVAWELERLRTAGIRQVIAFDLTKAELGLSVVRVVIPGLEALAENSSYVQGTRARARERALSLERRGMELQA